ncbi:MAG: DNA pilot protein [Microviridae sp.]|nr:MAG: DNA pilot protein [Microviridae sp.]
MTPEELGMQAAQGAAGTVIGLATAKWQDKRQLAQQQKLTAQQVAAQKDLGKFNQELAMQMWKDTNYGAQVNELQKAGLNPGLLYAKGGPGGTTQGGSAGSVAGGHAPTGGGEIGMGIQLGLQNQMMQAQIKLAESQANKNDVEAAKTAGVDTGETAGRIAKLAAETANERIKKALLEFDKQLAEATTPDKIDMIRSAARKIEGEATSAQANGEIDNQTQQNVITQINTATAEQQLRIKAQEAGLVKTGAETSAINRSIAKMGEEIVNMAANRAINWEKLGQTERETYVKERLLELTRQTTEFNTSTPQQIKQWTSIITDIIGTLTPLKGSTSKTTWQSESGSGESTTTKH